MTTLLLDRIAGPSDAPFEEVWIAVDGDKLVALDFNGFEARMRRLLAKRYARVTFSEKSDPCGFSGRLQRYFEGELDALNDIPVDTGGTTFQQAAWQALRSIPAGTMATYGEQAARVGRPRAVRAIGAANGRNPVAIVVPCHRVVGANGALTGYAGGVATKRWLLRHEKAMLM
jgi:methylated-DNA-[protein]-cysteine S-methyltransferase